MMNIRSYAWMAATVLMLGSCAKNESGDRTPERDKRIAIRTSIVQETTLMEVASRAPQLDDTGRGDFANGDRFSLLSVTPSGQHTALKYEVGSQGLYWRDLQTAPQDRSVDFAACYPEQELLDGKFVFDLEKTSDKDLLWAHRTGISVGTETPIDLTFTHAMHTLVLNFTVESTGLQSEEIQSTCTAESVCEVDLAAATLVSTGAPKASFTATGKKATFRIIPQKSSGVALKVTAGSAVKEFNLSEVATEYEMLESGKILTVNLKIKDGRIQFEGCDIAGWEDQGTVEGEIIM